MTSRNMILNRARAALAADTAAPTPVPRNYSRGDGQTSGTEATIELLIDRLIDYKALVTRTAAANLAAAIDVALTDVTTVVIPTGLDTVIEEACTRNGRTVMTDGRPNPVTPAELDRIDAVVTGARVAIALSGTIILDGEPDQGRRAITLIPDRHVIILRAQQVRRTVAEAVALLSPTRPLTMIAGPSATSDIELERVEGVHGPRTLQVIIVSD
jgi:L-lactate dehydrogenase complex protein LldG